ncbi:MAG: TIGR02996 domain-containing protein [Gemmataceae bacterium]
MYEQQALWQRVLDRPLSRMARQVYADWLEERGDPRGEFIQVQCAAERLPPADPRKLALDARADELLWRHEAEWLGPMRGRVRAWRFRRGLLEWVSVDAGTFLAHADEWVRGTGLLGVHLRRVDGHLEALAACPALGRLSALYLGENDLTNDQLRLLLRSRHLRQLRRLYLQCNRLDEGGAALIAVCPHLRGLYDLSLGRNFVGDAGVRALVASPHLTRLRRLDLLMTGLRADGVRALAGWPGLAQLRHLLLGSNVTGPGTLATLVRSPHWRDLRLLVFSMNDVSDADLQAVAAAPAAASLRGLDVSASRRLGDDGLQPLADSPHLNGLHELYLGHGTFGSAALDGLRAPRGLRRLRRLSLAGGFPGDAAAVARLLGGPLVRRLHWLDLDAVPLDDACTRALARGGPLRLRNLRIDLQHVSPEAWDRLVGSARLRHLTHLTVQSLPRGGLAALCRDGRLPALATLRLLSWKGTAAEVGALAGSGLLGRLRKLTLSGPIEVALSAGVGLLAASSAAAGLTHLDLGHSPLGDPAIRALTAGRHWGRLTHLDLSGCRLGRGAAEALGRWPALAGLRQLNLRSNRIEAAGAAALAASPHLNDLLCVDLDGAGLSQADQDALRRRLGGRVAFGWRTTPETIVFGASPHDDI